jgi:hypothetical protein
MRLFDSLPKEASCKIAQSLRDGADVQVYLNITFLDNHVERATREYTFWVSVTWVGENRSGPKLDGAIRLVPKSLGMYSGTIYTLEVRGVTDYTLRHRHWAGTCSINFLRPLSGIRQIMDQVLQKQSPRMPFNCRIQNPNTAYRILQGWRSALCSW